MCFWFLECESRTESWEAILLSVYDYIGTYIVLLHFAILISWVRIKVYTLFMYLVV